MQVDYELASRLKRELVKIQNEIKLALQNKQVGPVLLLLIETFGMDSSTFSFILAFGIEHNNI